MIRVELRTARCRLEPAVQAPVVSDDDGTHRVTGDRRLVDLTEMLLDLPGSRELGGTTDPAAWALGDASRHRRPAPVRRPGRGLGGGRVNEGVAQGAGY